MAKHLITRGTWVDDKLEDGYVRVGKVIAGSDQPKVSMSRATYASLATHCMLPSLYEAVERLPRGTHLIPRRVIDPMTTEEVERALALLTPTAEHSGRCVYPGCWQDVASTRHGFPLCAGHDADVSDWDDLVSQ